MTMSHEVGAAGACVSKLKRKDSVAFGVCKSGDPNYPNVSFTLSHFDVHNH